MNPIVIVVVLVVLLIAIGVGVYFYFTKYLITKNVITKLKTIKMSNSTSADFEFLAKPCLKTQPLSPVTVFGST